jgi:hypothetical protein
MVLLFIRVMHKPEAAVGTTPGGGRGSVLSKVKYDSQKDKIQRGLYS